MDTYSFYEEELCMFFDCICYYSGRCAVCPQLAEYDAYCEAHPIKEVANDLLEETYLLLKKGGKDV